MQGALSKIRGECDSVIAQDNFSMAYLETRLATIDKTARKSSNTSAVPEPAEVALPATTAPARTQPKSNYCCENCDRTSHPTQFCVRKGGGYDGWSVQVARDAQAAWEQGKPVPPRPAKKKEQATGGAQAHVASQPQYPPHMPPPFMHPQYGYPQYPTYAQFASPTSPVPPTPPAQHYHPAAFAAYQQHYPVPPPQTPMGAQNYTGTGYSMPPPGLLTDAPPPPGSYWPHASFIAAGAPVIPLQPPCIETDKSFALFHECPYARVDWRNFTRIPDAVQAYAAPVSTTGSRLPLSLADNPFFLDSGATAHISPERSDFIELAAITPRPVAGVGGSVIMATGMGTIRLNITRGHQLVLHNVLFVPSASVHLISVLALGVHSNFTAHFNKLTCWITDHSQRLIVSGTLFRNQLYALRLAPSVTTVHALPVRTRSPDIETWHGRFSHGAPHRTVVEAARCRTLLGKADSCIIPEDA
ncbi:unnamed protein product [Peniophora sp. CBMAI 1063]|nr:unnamed protein product [Peniophora sp. CBMAI 1063]